MTIAELQTVIKHASAMEAKGLSRRTAILTAFEHFPDDFRKCKALVEKDQGNEDALYRFLEYVIEKGPGSALGGLQLNAEAKTAKTHGNAPENPFRAQEIPPMQKKEGFAALKYITGLGIPLIGSYVSGAMIGKQEPENFTTDTAEIAALMEGKGNKQGKGKGTHIQRFYFIPEAAGLLCLDIDRKPGKPDGLKELYKLFPKDTLPQALQDIERFFPCYVKTPSGGYHLYFKYSGSAIRKTDLCPEVEIKHGKPGLTAPGSKKENGSYILYGVIEAAPPLYGIIIDRINELQREKPVRTETRAVADRPILTKRQTPHAWPQKPLITLDELAAETSGGNHDRQVSFAGKAFRCKFSVAETLDYVKANPAIFGNGFDTENTIKSVFKDNGGI